MIDDVAAYGVKKYPPRSSQKPDVRKMVTGIKLT